MAFYDDMADVATELLTEFGKSVTFEQVTTVFNPITGTDTTRTVTEHSTVGVEIPIRQALIDGSRVQVGDRFLIVDDSYAPMMADLVSDDAGAQWAIVAIEPINPAGTPIAYRVQVRK